MENGSGTNCIFVPFRALHWYLKKFETPISEANGIAFLHHGRKHVVTKEISPSTISICVRVISRRCLHQVSCHDLCRYSTSCASMNIVTLPNPTEGCLLPKPYDLHGSLSARYMHPSRGHLPAGPPGGSPVCSETRLVMQLPCTMQ